MDFGLPPSDHAGETLRLRLEQTAQLVRRCAERGDIVLLDNFAVEGDRVSRVLPVGDDGVSRWWVVAHVECSERSVGNAEFVIGCFGYGRCCEVGGPWQHALRVIPPRQSYGLHVPLDPRPNLDPKVLAGTVRLFGWAFTHDELWGSE